MQMQKPVEIAPTDGMVSPPDLFGEKTPLWYSQNVNFALSFYNQRTTYIGAPSQQDNASQQIIAEQLPPVQQMIRMLLYYRGLQPNMDYAFVTDDLSGLTMQSMWIRNQSVKEFVDYFKGNMQTRLVNAKWTGKPLSERATSERTAAWDKYMLAYDLKPFLKQLAEQFGAQYSGAQAQEFDLLEQVKKFMDTTWKEYGSELAQDIANGIWFKERWSQKILEAFMYVVITGTCAMHHYTVNGQAKQEIVYPHQLIKDNRYSNDFGDRDQFIGKIDTFTPNEIFTRYPSFTSEQREEIQKISSSEKLMGAYNIMPNLNWFTVQSKRGMVTAVTVYFRGKNKTGKKEVRKPDGNLRIAKAEDGDEDQFIYDDIFKATIVGNKYIVDFGPIDNIVEEYDDISRPMFPIIRFCPNTLLGENTSEVARIHKIVDEIDYLDYKIREMVGKSKGKVYWIDGSKFDEAQGFKGFLENVNAMGIHVGMPSGEDDKDRKAIELIDWTLDPNVDKLWSLVKEKEERMKRVMSTSDISMGQTQEYMGYNTTQTAIAQNSLGTAYLFDGTLEWVVLNMRYAANVQKNLYCMNDNLEASIVVGDRGVVQLKLWEGLTFEQLFVQLNINDQFDAEQKKAITDVALASAQNDRITFLDFIKTMKAKSMTEAENIMEYSLKENELKKSKDMQAQGQDAVMQMQAEKYFEAQLAQLKEDNANYRADVQALNKNVEMLMNFIQTQTPPPSPLTGNLQPQQQGGPQQ